MVLYLRDKKGNSIYEASIWVKTDYEKDGSSHRYVDLSTSIYIEAYSKLLISVLDFGFKSTSMEVNNLIHTFDDLSELRGWMWENYFMDKKNTPDEINHVIKEVREILERVAEKYKLNIVVD